jgi:hypothetical protein
LDGQTVSFPGTATPPCPPTILAACCEIAYALLDGVDPEIEMQNLSTVQHGFAALQETYDPRIVNMAFKHGDPFHDGMELPLAITCRTQVKSKLVGCRKDR